MAYNQELAQRIRALLATKEHTEKRMFGGIAFFANGNMACGVSGDTLMVRVGQARYEEALRRPHVRPFDMTGRPMVGWVGVGHDGYHSERGLGEWVRQGFEFAESLPAK